MVLMTYSLFPDGFQCVARGDGDSPVAADGVPDGVVLAREFGHLGCSGESDDSLSVGGPADFATGCALLCCEEYRLVMVWLHS